MFKQAYQHLGLLCLRLGLGIIMLVAHGLPKLDRFPGTNFPDPLGLGSQPTYMLAIGAEIICSVFVILGLWTRLALMPLIITMLTAVLLVHGYDPFAKKELGLLFLIGYISLFLTGAGRYSIDSKIQGK